MVIRRRVRIGFDLAPSTPPARRLSTTIGRYLSHAYVIHAEVAETLLTPLLQVMRAQQEPDLPDMKVTDPLQTDTLLNCGVPVYVSLPSGKNPFELDRIDNAVHAKWVQRPCVDPTIHRTTQLIRSQPHGSDVALAPRDRAAAERVAETALAAGKAKYDEGLYKKAIDVYQAGLLLLEGWENTTAWADIHIRLGMAKYQAGVDAEDPHEKRTYWSEARQSFDAAQLIYTQKLEQKRVWKGREERRQEKIWNDLAQYRDLVERALGGAYRPAFHIQQAAVDDVAEGEGFRWKTLEQSIAALQQQRQAVTAGERHLYENLIAGDPATVIAMVASRDARMTNSGPHKALNKAAERLALVLADAAVDLAILEGGKAQKRRAKVVLGAYQALANTDSAMEALKWAKNLLAQPESQLYRIFSSVTPDLKSTLETTILQPAFPVIEAAYDVGQKFRHPNPEHEREKIIANVAIAALRTAMFTRDLPNQIKTMRDPGSPSDRGANYYGRAAWPIKANWTWGNVMTLGLGTQQLASGEIWNGARYVLPAAGSLITFTNAWSKSFPGDSEFTGLRNLAVGKAPDKQGTLLNDIFRSSRRVSDKILSVSNKIVGDRQEVFLKRIGDIEKLLKTLAEKLTSNPLLSKFQSGFVAAEPWIVGLVVDGIAFYEHGFNREFSFANASAATGDALGFVANIALSIANHGANVALKARMLLVSTIISIIVQTLQLTGELIENLYVQTSEMSERIYPEHPFQGYLMLSGLERESIFGDSRLWIVEWASAVQNKLSGLLYQIVTSILNGPQDAALKP